MSTDAALHAHTPTILAREPRGLTVRRVAYHRRVATEVVEPRVDRVERDLAGRVRGAWDGRLPHLCGSAMHSLSGVVLRSAHVDAGWRAALNGVANERAYAWDARGVMHRFVHDACGRPVAAYEGIGSTRCGERLTYGAGSDTSGGAGRLVRHDDTSGTVQVAAYSLHGMPCVERRRFLSTLDDPDWPKALADRDHLLESEIFESRWRRDAYGTPWQQSDAGGHVRRGTFDIAGLPATLHVALDGAAEYVLSHGVVHDAEGRVMARRDGSVQTVARFEPASGHQVGLRRTVAARAIQDLTYEYDPLGNVTTMSDAASATDWFDPAGTEPVHRYDYDTLDQLVHAMGRESVRVDGTGGAPDPLLPGDAADNRLRHYVEDYDYDAGGNLVVLTHTAANATVTRRFTIEASSNRAVPVGEEGAIAYDGVGNRLHLRPGVPMQWDVRGRLAAVGALPDDERYRYDASGMRARKHSATGDVRYLPGMERRTAANGVSCDVLHLPHAGGLTRIVHWRSGKPDTDVQDLARIQVADLLGSICVEVTTDGTVLSDEAFHPFGSSARWAARDATTADGKVRRYGGKETDRTGLSYYGHRYYAPWLGRWISPDPAGDVDGPNRYRFARNNPCSGIDVDGRMFKGLRQQHTAREHRKRAAAASEYVTSLALETGRFKANDSLRRNTASTRVDKGLEDALSTINQATHLLFRAPDQARSIVARHLGFGSTELSHDRWEATRHTLFEGLDDMRNDLLSLRANTDQRLVLVSARRIPHISATASAFVYEADPHRRIFINADVFRSLGHLMPDGIRNALLHEPTHLFPRARATKDIAYFGGNEAFLASIDWATSYVPPASRLPANDKSATARAIRRIGPEYDRMPVDEQRRQMILHNADSWRAIALDLSRHMVDP